MKRLFLLGNPTHYLNTIEFLNEFDSEGHVNTIVIASEFLEGIDIIDNAIKNNIYKDVIRFDFKDLGNPSSSIKSFRLVKNFLEEKVRECGADELIIGNMSDIILYSVALNNHKKFKTIYALDDGIPTINILKSRRLKRFYFDYHLVSLKIQLKAAISLNTFLAITPPLKRVVFYSIYNLTGGKKDEVKENAYKLLGSQVISTEVLRGVVYFVGSHIVDKQLISRDKYLKMLVRVKNEWHAKGYDLKYVFHRAESKKMRDSVQKLVSTIEFNGPLEIALLDQKIPEVIAGNFSSALFTLSRLFKVPTYAYLFDLSDITGRGYETKEYIRNIYDAIEKDTFLQSESV